MALGFHLAEPVDPYLFVTEPGDIQTELILESVSVLPIRRRQRRGEVLVRGKEREQTCGHEGQ